MPDETRADDATRAEARGPAPDATQEDGTRAEAREPASGPGPKQIAHFRILRQLGAGGMGTVYLAHDERMNRQVALKVLARHLPGEIASRRFEQEAWIAGRLDHPNIVKVYERGQWEDLAYYSMELVDGGSLADVIEALRRMGRDPERGFTSGSSQAIHWALRTGIDAARALDAAHRHGIVHRDIKPVNLLLSRAQGTVKLADFGIAVDLEATRMTADGTVLGTVLYMAPEQIRGETSRIDARTDVYALGVTLFELLTLEMPYTGKTQQLYMSQVLTTETRRARGINAHISRDLETVLRKAMEKAPADRYATAAAFADDLENVLHLRPITARPAGPLRRTVKWVRRKPVHAALVAALIVGVPAAGILGARVLHERVETRRQRLADLLDEARWLGQRAEYGAMLDRATAALVLDPDNVLALRHRGMARFRLAESERGSKANTLREDALRDADAVIAAAPGAAWPHTLKAFMLTRMSRREEAAAEIARAKSLRPTSPSDQEIAEEARLAEARGERERAVELYSEMIRRQPDSVYAISSRAAAYEALGRGDSAMVDLRVAVGLNPRYDLAMIELARLSADHGLLDDAETHVTRALEIDPHNPFALETQGRIFLKRAEEAKVDGDRGKARALLQRAERATRAGLARSEKLLWGELNLGVILAQQARLSETTDAELLGRAIEGYEKVLAGYDGLPDPGPRRQVYIAAQLNLCDAQIELRRLREATQTCGRVAETSPDDAVAHYNLAGAHALAGNADEALKALRRDVELGDHDFAYLAADPWFTSLHSDPRFQAILADMKRKAG